MFKMKSLFLALTALCVAPLELPVSAGAAPAGLVTADVGMLLQQVRSDRRPRTRVRVYPYAREDYPYYARHDYPYGPPVRGFYDRNPTFQGNLNGCVVDLGYGRYESCDVGR